MAWKHKVIGKFVCPYLLLISIYITPLKVIYSLGTSTESHLLRLVVVDLGDIDTNGKTNDLLVSLVTTVVSRGRAVRVLSEAVAGVTVDKVATVEVLP